MTIPISPRRLASDDPQDAAILDARSAAIREAEELAEGADILTLLEIAERRGHVKVHQWLVSLAACQGENVCGKDRRGDEATA